MVASYIFPHGATSPTTEETLILSSSPSSASTIDKTKQRQQAAMLDAWLAVHGDNLYPCREEKERLAKDMSMTYVQVNRWFANRRRKRTKRRKTKSGSNQPDVELSPKTSSGTDSYNIPHLSEREEQRTLNWQEKSIAEKRAESEMVVHTVESDMWETDNEVLKNDLLRNASSSAHFSTSTFQQVPENCSSTSPSAVFDQHRIPQTTFDDKLLPTPPAYAPSPLNVAAAVGNFPAAVAVAAAQAANPFLLAAAALGLQQQQHQQQQQEQQQNALSTLPWVNSVPSFTAMLPYLQHLQAQAQQQAQAQVVLAQHIAVAQQAANLHQQLKTAASAAAVVQTSLASQQESLSQPQWLSPPPSVPPQVPMVRQTATCSSPVQPTGIESSSVSEPVLSPQLYLEPQPPSPPASSSSSLYSDEKQQQQFLFDEDLMIDSLMEERKDLSEKESIAVAVLAGMAACQR